MAYGNKFPTEYATAINGTGKARERTTLFAVVRNGAVQNNHNQIESAILAAAHLANSNKTYRIDGFDKDGRTAVVDRDTVVRIEVVRRRPGEYAHWDCIAIVAEWVAGERTV